MNTDKNQEKSKESEVRKQNQDLPNIPASSDKIHSEDKTKKEIDETSELHPDGKTDNTDHNSGK
ncbi:hypothetical protein [Chryseobacterium sp.]|uniref:hypothetical protein n=1 Tax=Chryseobacterium sp. TaxID=1871047 RepID=UPI0011CBFDF9|nr:hypothetical protein [Chryseobacterium sp.]TXF79436.1 hypothetical protein FUA25_03360 [Chryseobacterium sp.]